MFHLNCLHSSWRVHWLMDDGFLLVHHFCLKAFKKTQAETHQFIHVLHLLPCITDKKKVLESLCFNSSIKLRNTDNSVNIWQFISKNILSIKKRQNTACSVSTSLWKGCHWRFEGALENKAWNKNDYLDFR